LRATATTLAPRARSSETALYNHGVPLLAELGRWKDHLDWPLMVNASGRCSGPVIGLITPPAAAVSRPSYAGNNQPTWLPKNWFKLSIFRWNGRPKGSFSDSDKLAPAHCPAAFVTPETANRENVVAIARFMRPAEFSRPIHLE